MQVTPYPVANYGASIPALRCESYTLIVGEQTLPLHGLVQPCKDGIEFVHDGSAPEVMQARINAVVKALFALPDAITKFQTEHDFSIPGLYIRRLYIPKGMTLVGKVHKLPCVNVVERGDIAILTATASARVKAGFTIVSPAGICKVGHANEDTVFTNIFRTDETDPSKIEDVIAWDSFESMRSAIEGDIVCQQDG